MKTYGSRSRLSSSPLLSPTPVLREMKHERVVELNNTPGKANCPTKSPHSDSESSSTLWVIEWIAERESLSNLWSSASAATGRRSTSGFPWAGDSNSTWDIVSQSRVWYWRVHCSPPHAKELPSQQWDWCPPLYPSSGHSSGLSPGSYQSHCWPVRWNKLNKSKSFEKNSPQVQIRLVPCSLTVGHFLLCNGSVVSSKILNIRQGFHLYVQRSPRPPKKSP